MIIKKIQCNKCNKRLLLVDIVLSNIHLYTTLEQTLINIIINVPSHDRTWGPSTIIKKKSYCKVMA